MTFVTTVVRFYTGFKDLEPQEKTAPNMINRVNEIKTMIEANLSTPLFLPALSHGVLIGEAVPDLDWVAQLVTMAKTYIVTQPPEIIEELQPIFDRYSRTP